MASQKPWLSGSLKMGLLDNPKAVAFAFCVAANVAISFVEMPDAWVWEVTGCCLLVGFYCWHCRARELRVKCKDKAAGKPSCSSLSVARDGQFFQLQAQISRFARASQPMKAEEALRDMQRQQLQPSLPIYSQIATAWVRSENVERAETLLEEMLSDGVVPDAVIVGLMVHTYATRRDLESAERWHARLAEYGIPRDRGCFSRIINACAKASNIEKALCYLEEMVTAGIKPEVITFSCLLDACANAGDLELAKQIFKRMKCSDVELNAVPYACLGRIFAGRGMFAEVEQLFQDMQDAGISMNEYCVCTLLTAYGRSFPRESERAEKCFRSAVQQGILINGKVLAALRSATSQHVYQELQRFANQGFQPRHCGIGEAQEKVQIHREPTHCRTSNASKD